MIMSYADKDSNFLLLKVISLIKSLSRNLTISTKAVLNNICFNVISEKSAFAPFFQIHQETKHRTSPSLLPFSLDEA